jgi:hypothetical protein
VVVRSGLQAGQQVVASGQFLIDSEASLQGLQPPRPKRRNHCSSGQRAAGADRRVHQPAGVVEALEGTSDHPEPRSRCQR